ncbi:phosphate propanoyltransferase [Lachnoclostridium phytofermentans]|uniref:Phosphate propanoyltransferase n=1 Tax=Lachnoclostridium phytofermentans (strain ATCC 700394 / DSM 18823 / ISDg) TaxID=357809 RepID=A9KPE2_LACP7|nr:phosphate propanoyltransferase [Lachnoclostridium phytofermentans]ABX41804.1 Propanediol utilization protein [Lachnoclostridium phytofermentans ISDg]
MDKYEAVIKLIMEAMKTESEPKESKIPVGVSNRHVHLSQEDLDILFGQGYQLTNIKELSQPGQYACKEMVTVCGPKGAIEKVRILGPVRKQTQVEILAADCFKLGTNSEPKMSGELAGTPGITLVGPKGSVQTKEGLIIAQRHIHMSLEDASKFGVHDGQTVNIQTEGARGGIFSNVAIRANNSSSLECHLDTEEANAMGLGGSSSITIVK